MSTPPTSLSGARLIMVAPSSSAHTPRWARYFQSCGMQVMVISPTDDAIDGVPLVKFPARRRWYHRLKGIHLRIDYRAWRRLFADFRPDLVHLHYPDGGSRNKFYYDDVDKLIVSTWGSEVVESPRFPLSAKHKAGVRAAIDRAVSVTATTRFLAKATAPYCRPGRPIHIIPFGVDCDRFSPAGTQANPSRPPRLGFMKNLEPKYGPEVLVEAFAGIAKAYPSARLIVCGKGPMEATLKARVAQLGLVDLVEFPGRIPHERVPDLLRSLDLLVMPSTCQESFGVAAIEASACCVPVVATNVGGVPEAVLDGQTGTLVPPGDAASLADACLRLIGDPDRRRDMGQAGRHFVLANYQWRDNAAEMRDVYEQVLDGGPVQTRTMIVAQEER